VKGTFTFLRYSVTGVFAFLVDLAITLALSRAVHYLVANSAGFVVANFLQFLIVHQWVFRQSFKGKRVFSLYLATLAISLLGLVSSNVFVYIGVDLLGFSLAVAKAITAVIVLGINYSLRVASVYKIR
jgi:putative flippase GtrA